MERVFKVGPNLLLVIGGGSSDRDTGLTKSFVVRISTFLHCSRRDLCLPGFDIPPHHADK